MNQSKLERLPDSELAVMKVIWEAKQPVGTCYIVKKITEDKDWTRSTIQVLLTRLKERNFIQCEKKGRLMFYSPLIDEDFYLTHETKNFLEQFYNNSYKNLIASLVTNKTITPDDLDEIIDIIKGSPKSK